MQDAPQIKPAAGAADAVADPLPVDTHAHLHAGVGDDALLQAAAANFTRHLPRDVPADAPRRGVLCLTESAGVRRFDALAARDDAVVSPSGLGVVLRVNSGRSRHPFRLGLLAGRQVITRERIEVLALGVGGDPLPDGKPAVETLDVVLGLGGLPVLPYGVGKWRGARGRLVTGLISSSRFHPLAVGDIAGRPTLGPRPAQLDLAAARGLPLLLGTDPLRLPGDHAVAGRFGNLVDLPPDLPDWPARLVRLLGEAGPVPHRFGDHLPLRHALGRQVRLRLHRGKPEHSGKRGGA